MLLLLFAAFTSSEFKISHLNALLRFKDPNSNIYPHFTISAEGSCVNWTSLNPNVVRVTAIHDSRQCSKSALVEVVATGPSRKSTSIRVVDHSGQSLKCDVFVDNVDSISILTTTRSIYLKSSKETLYLQAFDSEKNIFTSLEGTNIDWKLDQRHLQMVDPSKAKVTTQSASSMSHPKSSAQLIVQGIEVGKTWASASIDGKYFSSVNLTVVEPIGLFPPVVRVLPYTHVQYKLCSTRGNFQNEGDKQCYSQIQLPKEDYKLETSNSNVITTDNSAYVTVHREGTESLVAIDQHMTDNTASALVIVSYPSKYIQEEQYIALGDDPEFHPVLFDKDGEEYSYNYFEKIEWEIIGEWKTIGRKEITLRYHECSLKAIVHVCPPLTVSPKTALLPKDYSGFPLTVSGGSGQSSFKINSESIIRYLNGKVDTLKYGKTQIIFQDSKIPKFTATAEIEVSRVDFIDIKLEYRETIKKPFQPTCEVFATDHRKFDVNVQYKVQSSNLDVVSSDMSPENPGFSDIYCESGDTQSDHLKVSVASNLKAEVDGIASPYSKIPLKLTGGVLKWPLSDKDPNVEIRCSDSVSQLTENNIFSIDREFSGFCTISMQNPQTSQNPHPILVESQFELKVHNVDRFAMHLVDTSQNGVTEPRCNFPASSVTDPYNAKRGHNITLNRQYRVHVYAIDAQNQLIKYYSADKFSLETSPEQHYSELQKIANDPDFSTQFSITPIHPVNLSIKPLFNHQTHANSLFLNSVADFTVDGETMHYYHAGRRYEYTISGGSGLFSTKFAEAYVRDSTVYVNPQAPGNYRIEVRDTCNPGNTHGIDLNLVAVDRIQIEAPRVVAFNAEFEATVKAYDRDGQLISQAMYEEANIRITNANAQKVGYNVFRLNASVAKQMLLTAEAENGAKAQHVVEVVQSIVVSPQYIELLPGETQHVTVVCGPSDIEFDDGYSKIATFDSNSFDVIAISPGRVTINVTARNIEGLPAFPIFVHVIKPIELKITPSSDHVVQYGKILLSVTMNTDCGIRPISNPNWTIPRDFSYDMINSSIVVIRCIDAKFLNVRVSAYGLSDEFSINVEPKLKLLSPSEVFLPTYCSYKINVENNLDCRFDSLDNSIVATDNNNKGMILSKGEGEAIVVVHYGHQFLTVNVKVSKPTTFYLTQVQSSLEYQLVLLNPDGLEYTTTKCLNFDISVRDAGSTDFRSLREVQKGRTYSITSQQLSFDQPLEISAIVSNEQYTEKRSFFLTPNTAIKPAKPIFLKGYGKQMKCAIATPNWMISDTSVASVDKSGFVSTRNEGITQLSCGNGIATMVKVIDVKAVRIEQDNNYQDENAVNYKVDVVLSDSSLLSEQAGVIKPDDFAIFCSLDSNSQSVGCGTASHVHKNGQDYCVFRPNKNGICPSSAKVIVTAGSPSIGLHQRSEAQIPQSFFSSNKNDYQPSKSSKGITVLVSDAQREVLVPLNFVPDATSIRSSRGITATIAENGEGIIVRAEDDFDSYGSVNLNDRENGQLITIQVKGRIHHGRRSGFARRGLDFTGNEYYYITLILVFLGAIWLFLKFCF